MLRTASADPQRDDERGLAAFRPIRVRKVADEVVTVIVDAIRGGLYEPGDRLPREADLAAKLEVSRTTVREAISTLQRDGIVSVRRGNNGGGIVATRSISAAVLAAIEGESHATTQSLLEVRRSLETTAAMLAVSRATESDLAELRRLTALLPDLIDHTDEFLAVDMEFHARLAETSGNEMLAEYVRETLRRYELKRRHLPVGHVEWAKAIRLHQDTCAALEGRDPGQVAAALDEHLGAAEEHFLGERLQQ